jgi:hypothetical protein
MNCLPFNDAHIESFEESAKENKINKSPWMKKLWKTSRRRDLFQLAYMHSHDSVCLSAWEKAIYMANMNEWMS